MGKSRTRLDLTHQRGDETVGKFSFWLGILSIPSSVFLLGIPLGAIAYFMGGKVLKQTKTSSDVGGWGKATLGRFFGCAGIILSVLWGLALIVMVVVGVIGSLLNAILA